MSPVATFSTGAPLPSTPPPPHALKVSDSAIFFIITIDRAWLLGMRRSPPPKPVWCGAHLIWEVLCWKHTSSRLTAAPRSSLSPILLFVSPLIDVEPRF